MRKGLSAAIVFIAGLAIAFAILIGKPKPAVRPPQQQPLPIVDVLSVVPHSERLVIRTQGTVQPKHQIDVVTQVAGIVESTNANFAVGAFLQRDETLLRIEADDYQFALLRSQATVAEAQQLMATERARANQAQKEWHDLGQLDANNLFLRKPQLASAKAKLDAAIGDSKAAQLNLSRTHIKIPFDGRIQHKFVDAGQYLVPGTIIAKIYSTDSIEIRLPLTDQQISQIDLPNLNQASNANVDITAVFADQEHHWPARLVRTEASFDIQNRDLYVIVEVDDPFAFAAHSPYTMPLGIGLFVQASITGKKIDNVIRLPRQALQVDQQLLGLDQNNRLVFKPIKVLHANDTEVLVQGNFDKKERFVVSNLPLAVKGMQVEPHFLELDLTSRPQASKPVPDTSTERNGPAQ